MPVKKKGVKNANTKTAHVLNLITTADDPTGEGQNAQGTGVQGVEPAQMGGQAPTLTQNPSQTGQTSHHPIQNGAYHGSVPNSANVNVAMVDDDALGLCIQDALTEHVNAELAQVQRTIAASVAATKPVPPAPLPPLDPSLLTPDAFDTSDLPEDLFADIDSPEDQEYSMTEEETDHESLLAQEENIDQSSTLDATYEEEPESSLPQEEYMEEYVEQEVPPVVEPSPSVPLSPISQAAMESQTEFHYTPSTGQTAPISPIQEAAMGGQPAQLPPLSQYTAPTFDDVPLEQVSHSPLPETLPPEPLAPPSNAPVAELASMDHMQQYSAPNFDQVPPPFVSQATPPPQPVPPPPVSSLAPDSLFEEVFVEELELPAPPPRTSNQFPPMVGANPPMNQSEQAVPMPQPSTQHMGQPIPMPQQMAEPVQMPQQQPQQMAEPVQMPQQQPQQMAEPVQMPQQQPQQMAEPVQMPQQQPQQMAEPVQIPQQQPQQMVQPEPMPQQQPQQMVQPEPMPQQAPQQMVQPEPMPQQAPQQMVQPEPMQPVPEEQGLELTPPITMEPLSNGVQEVSQTHLPPDPQPSFMEHAVPPTFPSAVEQTSDSLPEPPPSFQGDTESGGLFIEDSGNREIPTSIFLDPILPPDAVNPSSISLEPSAPMELGAIDPVEMPMDFQSMTTAPSDTQFEFNQGGNTGFTEFDTVMNDDSIDPMNPMLGRKLGEPVEYYNLTEQLVREMAPKFLQTFGTCTCEQCLLDVIAHTLCHLKPKYVVRYQAAFPEIQGEYKKEFASTIVSQLGKSCIAINEKPRHLKPFMGNS